MLRMSLAMNVCCVLFSVRLAMDYLNFIMLTWCCGSMLYVVGGSYAVENESGYECVSCVV